MKNVTVRLSEEEVETLDEVPQPRVADLTARYLADFFHPTELLVRSIVATADDVGESLEDA